MRILLAEDEKELSRALTAILEHSKYAVDAVYDGLAAVESAENNAYDAMIFDIMMPKLDGIEALKQIRSHGNFTPVLLLTAKAEISDRIVGLDAGADDYLTKPFAMGELLARIRSMTRRAGDYTPKKLRVGSVTLDMEQLTEYDFWYADYHELPQCPYDYKMWQYSEAGTVPGIRASVDLDLWFQEEN